MIIRPVGAKLIVAFRNSANASKKESKQNGKVGNEDEIVHYSVTGQIGDGKTGDTRF
jgi:nitrous oxide reductase accessory protein NosL